MKLTLAGIVQLFVLVPGLATDIDLVHGCKENPAVVAACYSIRGRIAAYNGTPSLRIWPVGSTRLLGVLPSEHEIVPDNVRGMVSFKQSVYANLEVCPFTPAHSRTMQFVCIESATNVKVRLRP